MNESLISKIKDENARKVIYHQHLQIEALKRKLDTLERQKQPTQAIGFHTKEGEKQLDRAFKNVRYVIHD